MLNLGRYTIFCIFWGLNMGMINGGTDVKWVKTKNKPAAAAAPRAVQKNKGEKNAEGAGKMSRLKHWVKNAVNCCIE